eukprot:TRINITY_DN9139_c0_g1_i1.p1 TRINITY_DN9139_c0_g1~~TRINITY_DN9139_c0_g1_i1.p1  ORF type:complete len:270 (+),score=26.14 TRINITY_DN9139_c0_g1_i1:111-920(+)
MERSAPSNYSLLLNQSELPQTMESLTLSVNSNTKLSDPPISPGSTYESNIDSQSASPSTSEISPRKSGDSTIDIRSVAWDYDNFLEKPREPVSPTSYPDTDSPNSNSRGHVAQPRYIQRQREENGSATTFDEHRSEDRNGHTPFSSESFTTSGLSPTLLAILAYFFGVIGAFIVIIFERKNLFVLFHAWQSLVCGVLSFLLQMLFFWSSKVYTVLWISYLAFNFYMIFRVIKDAPPPSQRFCKVPGIGDWCERAALNRIQHHAGSFYRL